MSTDARLQELLPGGGVCPHDLRFIAATIRDMYGAARHATEPVDILSAAVSQAGWELRAVAAQLGENHDLYWVVTAIEGRLDAANEMAELVSKLLTTIKPLGGEAP